MNQTKNFKTSSGSDSGDLYFFLNSVKLYAEQFNSKDVWIAWDKKILYPSTNFRQETSTEYKDNRDKEKAKEVFTYEQDLKQLTESIGIKNIYPRIMEADDVISWLTTQIDKNITIVSADSDLCQLISNKVSIYHPLKKKLITIDSFEADMGIPINQYLVYKSIVGDTADNIKGVNGYGKVKAKRLTLDYMSNNIIDEHRLIIERNLKLMDLSKGFIYAGPEEELAYKEQYESLKIIKPNFDEFIKLCEKYEFNMFIKNISRWQSLFDKSKLISLIDKLA